MRQICGSAWESKAPARTHPRAQGPLGLEEAEEETWMVTQV